MFWWTAKKLKSPDYATRSAAIMKLGRSGNPDAVEPLIGALLDPSNLLLWGGTADALGRLKDPRAVVPLMEALLEDRGQSASRCRSAIESIGAAAVKPLLSLVNSEKDRMRIVVANLLGSIGGDEAVGGLIALLRDANQYVRANAATALGEFRDRRAVDALMGEVRASQSKEAVEALVKIGESRAAPAIQELLSNKSLELRNAAVKALRAFQWEPGDDVERALYAVAAADWNQVIALGRAAIEPLNAAIAQLNAPIKWDEFGFGRHPAEKALLTVCCDQRVPEPLACCLRNNKGGKDFVDALIRMGDVSIPSLIPLLQNPVRRVQELALRALDSLGWRPATVEQSVARAIVGKEWSEVAETGPIGRDALFASLEHETDPIEREKILRALAALEVAGLAPDTNRQRATLLIARCRFKEVESFRRQATEPLIAALRWRWGRLDSIDPYKNPTAIIHTLGNLGDERAVAELVRLAESSEECYQVGPSESQTQWRGNFIEDTWDVTKYKYPLRDAAKLALSRIGRGYAYRAF